MDESLLDSKIPSMILQPLIENCVNHGIRGMEGRGRIRVSVLKEDDRPCILIADNGAGMSEDTIQRIMSGEKISDAGRDSNGIGMDNVIARLKLFTGREDVFEIRSEGKDRGTEFRIRLNREEVTDV